MTNENSVTLRRDGAVGLIRIDVPPVNAINAAMRVGLAAALAQAESTPEIKTILITTAGKVFMAGADISEFDGKAGGPPLAALFTAMEASAKPIVVAIQGLALGGGLELAMACHYRLCAPGAQLGLPEITLGLIPGAGGTQRLPRLIGARAALDMMLSGAAIPAAAAKEAGLIDEIVTGDLAAAGLAFCEELALNMRPPRRTCALPVPGGDLDEAGIEAALAACARALKGRTTQTLVVQAVKAAALPFASGMEIEADLARQTVAARESQALRHLFFAERNAGKIRGLAADLPSQKITQAAIIGAGTMGSGIAQTCADAGVSVTLIDSSPAGLARGMEIMRSNYQSSVKRGRLTQEAADERARRITGSLDIADAAGADFVVEAVFEDLQLKKEVLARIDAILPPDRLIASNTSSLSVTELGRATAHPGRVVGLHFFSPANVMKLLEIVRSDTTAPESLKTALQVARLLKKIGVVAGDGSGFIGNRMMLDGYFREAELLMLEGATPTQVDTAIEAFGFAMGPQRVSVLGGIDVGTKSRIEMYKRETREDPYFVIADRLTAMGRLGQKTAAGFYRYEPGGRTALPDPEVTALIDRLAAERGIARRLIGDDEIVERCLLGLINVGAMVLEEKIAARAADIDVVWTSGYGFPRYLGGPMFYADTLGLAHVADPIRHYHAWLGHYWRPSALLERLAADGGSFAQWDRDQA